MNKIALLITLFPVFIFLWEHIALTNDIEIKPTLLVDKATLICEESWRIAGIFFAYLGAYYEYLHLDRLLDTFEALACSIYRLIISVRFFTLGFDSIAKLYNHPNIIYICSATLLILAMGLIEALCRRLVSKRNQF
jgi:hypothetical protein